MQARRLGWISALPVICLSATAAGAANSCKLLMTPQIPVTIHNLRPVITVNIDGSDAQFIVDTGSFYDFISPAGAAQLKLPIGNAPFGLYALKLQPKTPWARYVRGLIELKKGMSDQGQTDLAAAKAQRPHIAEHFASFGLKP